MLNSIKLQTSIPADRWEGVSIIAVDVETNTKDPTGKSELGSYGLSYVADITDVSLIDVAGDRGLVFTKPTKKEKKFIAELLGRDNITIIAHNAIFDLRSLGGHYGFQIARHSFVWDTQTIGIRLLMGDLQGRGMDLLTLATRLEVIDGKDDFSLFMEEMKGHRKDLSNLAVAMTTMPPDNPLWKEVGGYIPPTKRILEIKSTVKAASNKKEAQAAISVIDEDERFYEDMKPFIEAAKRIIAKYVLADSVLATEIYKVQRSVVDRLVTGVVSIGSWYKLPPMGDRVLTQLDWWLRGLRVAANQAIVGVKMDTEYTNRLLDECNKTIDESSVRALGEKDNSDPYPNFNDVFAMLYYYFRVLDVCKDTSNTYSTPKNWTFWKPMVLSKDFLKTTMDGDNLDEWMDFLRGLDPLKVTRGEVLKECPKSEVPTINLEKYVERICFEGKYGSQYLAQIKTKWWTEYYTSPKSKKVTQQQLLNKKSFKPYFLFVICGIDLPSKKLLGEFPRLLLTGKGFAAAQEVWDDNGKLNPLSFMIDNQLSFGKDGLRVYMTSVSDEDKKAKVANYREFIQAVAKKSMLKELLGHAQRDGRIHSVIAPKALTTRGTSSGPNLQNLNMKIMRGVLIGDGGRVLMEEDLNNAENVMGTMTSGDDTMAETTEEGDFHFKQAANYFSKEWDTADDKEKRRLRNIGKKFTFGTAYGMGAVSMQLGLRELEPPVYMTIDKIRDIIEAKDRAYPKVAQQKQAIMDRSKARFNAGYKPAYIALWSGERVQIPHVPTKQGLSAEPAYRNGWNSTQQGGVSVIISRSKVEMQEWLEDNGYDTRIALDIHDSHISNCVIEEAEVVIPKNTEFLGSQVPVSMLRRTTPMVHFVSCVGPENADKWGYVDGREYPLPKDKFYNQWGVFDMPEGEDEAPVWRGPKHLGWTLAKETKALKEGVELDAIFQGQFGLKTNGEVDDIDEAIDLQSSFANAVSAMNVLKNDGYTLSTPQLNGKDPKTMHLPFAALGQSLTHLSNRGHQLPVMAIVTEIQTVTSKIDLAINALMEEKRSLEKLYEELPDQHKSPNGHVSG